MSQNVQTMKDLATDLGNRLVPIRVGELSEARVVQLLKNKIIVDVAGLTLGIIPEQEFSPDMGDLKPGDKLLAYVLTVENDEGYAVLSLRRADKERITKILQEKLESGEAIAIKVTDANKGGLLCQFGDYEGFLPVSQLASSHYPKVSSGNREEIFARLKSLVGKTLQVKILTFESANNKLIFSEKAAGDVVLQEKIKDIKMGETLEGEITGIVDFGLFVKTKLSDEDEIEGLVHISEASWEHVDDLKKQFEVGQKIKVQVIAKEGNRLSLSIKRLQSDPWLKRAKAMKEGEIVEAEVTKITPFGAFVRSDGLDGLVHVSELGEKVTDPKEVLKEGESYKFKILSIEPDLHKLSLSRKGLDEKSEDKEVKEKKATTKKIKPETKKKASTKSTLKKVKEKK